MKRIITSAALVILICVASAYALPATTAAPDHAVPGGVRDVVVAHETIKEQQETIHQDVRDTHQDIQENRSAGHENIVDQRQAMRTDVRTDREDVRDNLTTPGEAREDIRGNLTAGHEDIHDQRVATRTFIHGSRVTLAHNVSELRSQIETERDANQAQIANLSAGQKLVLGHMYASQTAAHSLMEMRDIAGDVGPRVADIAEDLNTSAATVQPLEQRIDERNAAVRFFFGGDRDAADRIQGEVTLNQARIDNLTQLMQDPSLQPDVQQAMQEQVNDLQQEQARLSDLAGSEHNATGLFGWIWH